MRILLLLVLVFNFLFANTTIIFQKGWQLVGVPKYLENMDIFDNKDVDIVWGFNAQIQQWQGYSPDINITQKISNAQLQSLNSLEPWQAVWVLSKKNWSLTLKEEDVLSEPTNNFITLKKGWNLVSIPQKSIVSERFFKDAVVWKYELDSGWSVNDSSLNFPTVDQISSSEGLWVKSEEDRIIDVGETLSKLQTFSSESEMLEYIRKMVQFNQYRYYGYMGIMEEVSIDSEFSGGVPVNEISSSESETSKDSSIDATTTNIQEDGVDESDILKQDGTYIYSVDKTNQRIIITSFAKIAMKDFTLVNSIDTKNKNILGIYLQEDRLILISNQANYSIYSSDIAVTETKISPVNYAVTELSIYDVSDVNNIKELLVHTIDGNYNESRLIDGKLFLISQFYPEISYEYPKIYIETTCNELYKDIKDVAPIIPGAQLDCSEDKVCQDPNNPSWVQWYDNNCYDYSYDADGNAYKYDYNNPIIVDEKLIPEILTATDRSPLVKASKFYAPVKLDQNANITSLSSFNINDGSLNETISFLGNTHTYYASLSSLYLVSSEYPLYYDFHNYQVRQMIYKFSIGTDLEYKGRGFVNGSMLNQFSMSEKDDYLRIATTVGNSWSRSATVNSVFTLKEEDSTLEVKGTLTGLGKEGETIKAVRFLGDRGFVVTFRQTDPLYTLDMSDPLNPNVVGELSIAGFSRYLHIVDENRVLSIGRDADETGRTLGLQIQLFDITDFANPILADKILIGDNSTYSEAEYNHKAFVYRPSDKVFGIPYQNYNYTKENNSENFAIYQLENMKINLIDTLSVSTENSWEDNGRGLIFDLNNLSYGSLIKGSNILSNTIKLKDK